MLFSTIAYKRMLLVLVRHVPVKSEEVYIALWYRISKKLHLFILRFTLTSYCMKKEKKREKKDIVNNWVYWIADYTDEKVESNETESKKKKNNKKPMFFFVIWIASTGENMINWQVFFFFSSRLPLFSHCQ